MGRPRRFPGGSNPGRRWSQRPSGDPASQSSSLRRFPIASGGEHHRPCLRLFSQHPRLWRRQDPESQRPSRAPPGPHSARLPTSPALERMWTVCCPPPRARHSSPRAGLSEGPSGEELVFLCSRRCLFRLISHHLDGWTWPGLPTLPCAGACDRHRAARRSPAPRPRFRAGRDSARSGSGWISCASGLLGTAPPRTLCPPWLWRQSRAARPPPSSSRGWFSWWSTNHPTPWGTPRACPACRTPSCRKGG
mmetsp:Transcript_7750/g.29080  ORF Transcript_7750/g.29080 Transcript_7750/m.29080 type:complete len:249 (-) Transcript_7750:397-1143(-)